MTGIKFNLTLYSSPAIERSIKDFSSIAKFSIKRIKPDIVQVRILKLLRTDFSKDQLYDEFANYVLGMAK